MINPALTGLAGAACCAVAVRGIMLIGSPSAAERRELEALGEPTTRRRGPTRQLIDALGRRFGPMLLARMSQAGREKAITRINRAGRPGGMNLERYAELRAAVLVLALLLGLLLLTRSIPVAILIVVLGFIGPDVWLSNRGRRRQWLLERDLPDFIDILAITVRAGTGYRAALARVAESLTGPPAEEILATLRQMDLGATRREAFEALRERNDSRTLDGFVAAQLQAEELGVPLADALASIASDTRRSAAQNARRRAQRVTPMITLISVFLLMPATALLIGVGLVISTGTGLGVLHGG